MKGSASSLAGTDGGAFAAGFVAPGGTAVLAVVDSAGGAVAAALSGEDAAARADDALVAGSGNVPVR